MTDEGGESVGDFCSDGIIQKVQVHTNISITAGARDFSKSSGPFLNVSFSQEISGKTPVVYNVGMQAAASDSFYFPADFV